VAGALSGLEQGAPERAARLRVLLADGLTLAGRADALERLEEGMTSVERDGTPEDRVLAYVVLGRAHGAAGRSDVANAWYTRALDLWRTPSTEAVVRKLLTGAPEGRHRLASVLRAVSEALFHAAEEKRRQATALAMPTLTGPATREAVRALIFDEVRDWIRRKQAAVAEASAHYQRVADLEPGAPPEWAVRALFRAGTMWADFADECRSLPMPEGFDGEQAAAYRASLLEATGPTYSVARRLLTACVDHAARFAIADDSASGCVERRRSLPGEGSASSASSSRPPTGTP
jgi:tetratricopeptide (TPR) repeat protein